MSRGGVVSTVQEAEALVSLPPSSWARTVTVWEPSATPETTYGDVHGWKASPSSAQLTLVAPDVVNSIVDVVALIRPRGGRS